ncbi:MAG: hypothetical protein NTW86_24670, partial [Candidatus Sumerlaeota bacterium]|nr:hypothetical protein [Candidatus Sumerlaeota bacterium]
MGVENKEEAAVRGTSRALATAGGVGSIVLWCFSGVCYACGSRALGAMPYVALMAATGVVTVIFLQLARRKPLSDLVLLPRRVMVAGFFGVALYTVILAWAVGMAPDRDVAQVMLMNYLWPIWIVALGMALLDDRLKPFPTLAGALL